MRVVFGHKSWDGTPAWGFDEVVALVRDAGGSTAHLERVGSDQWQHQPLAEMMGERGDLSRIAERLESVPVTGRRWIDTYIHCANERSTYDSSSHDRFSVSARLGTDIQALVARHGGQENESTRFEHPSLGRVSVTLKTTAPPEQLFDRVMAFWRDREVLTVDFNFGRPAPA